MQQAEHLAWNQSKALDLASDIGYIVRILLKSLALLSDTILVVCKKTRYTNFMHLRAVWTLEGLKPASIADLTVTNLAISSILVTLYAA